MSEYVSISGIDGSGKTTAAFAVGTILGDSRRVGILTSSRQTPCMIVNSRIELLRQKEFAIVNSAYKLGQSEQNRPLILAAFLGYLLLRERVVRPQMENELSTDYVIGDRDPRVDSVVLIKSYLSKGWLREVAVRTLEVIVGNKTTDFLFLLSGDTNIAHSRIQEQGRSDLHETPEKLRIMADYYPPVIDAMVRAQKIKWWEEIDTKQTGAEAVAKKICATVLEGQI